MNNWIFPHSFPSSPWLFYTMGWNWFPTTGCCSLGIGIEIGTQPLESALLSDRNLPWASLSGSSTLYTTWQKQRLVFLEKRLYLGWITLAFAWSLKHKFPELQGEDKSGSCINPCTIEFSVFIWHGNEADVTVNSCNPSTLGMKLRWEHHHVQRSAWPTEWGPSSPSLPLKLKWSR